MNNVKISIKSIVCKCKSITTLKNIESPECIMVNELNKWPKRPVEKLKNSCHNYWYKHMLTHLMIMCIQILFSKSSC